jgi:hypothetical protein
MPGENASELLHLAAEASVLRERSFQRGLQPPIAWHHGCSGLRTAKPSRAATSQSTLSAATK